MQGLFPVTQSHLKDLIQGDFFERLPQLASRRENEYLKDFSRYLAPNSCTSSSAKALESYISSHRDLPSIVIKQLRVNHQENQRCVAIQTSLDKPSSPRKTRKSCKR